MSRLRSLLQRPGIIRSLAPHDVFTARVLADAGVELLFLGGFGMAASSLGLPDLGLATLSEMVEAVRRITQRVSVPLIADGDTGHGDLLNVAWTVRQFEAAGASGILLEDQVSPKRCGHFAGKRVVPVELMLDKLHAALDARRSSDFVIIARTDARAVLGLNCAIDRACQYAETGVDIGFVEAPQSRDELVRVAREVPIPQLANMLPGGVTPLLPIAELEQIGFKIAVDPVATLMLTARAVQDLAREWLGPGAVSALTERMASFAEVKRLAGVDEFLDWGDRLRPWARPQWIKHTQLLLDSFRERLGYDLIDREGDEEDVARRLYESPRIVVSHGTEADPILNYGNRAALKLWEMDLNTFVSTPSRMTAEPVHRDERARLLERTRRDGFVDDYRGIRISRTGKRFLIEQAIVWNLATQDGQPAGQAATFDRWTPLE